MNSFNLKHQTALVCGASQGIGAATAKAFAECGARVILLARSESGLKKVLQTLPGTGHLAWAFDLQNLEPLNQHLEEFLKENSIGILVNNSGGPAGGPILSAEPQNLLQAFQQHILSAQFLAQKLSPGMKQARYGRIINIISTSVKAPIPGLGVSNTIRGAMASWSKTLAGELGAHGITVNNLLPGYTKTERLSVLKKASAERLKISETELEKQWLATIPAARFGEPEEIAQAIAFLASPWASYINGINLPVDGGRTQSL